MDYSSLLKKHGLKKTPTRMQVLEVYENHDHALAIADVEDELGEDFDRVTLYRTLSTFEEKGLLHKVFDDEGKMKYSLCGTTCDEHTHHDNHLHFHCRKCGQTTCVDSVPVPTPDDLKGFIIHDVYMVANGICKACA